MEGRVGIREGAKEMCQGLRQWSTGFLFTKLGARWVLEFRSWNNSRLCRPTVRSHCQQAMFL